MRTLSAMGLVFLGGFALMVLEIVGARYLGKDFGGAFYVWVSQIGVILIALALGSYAGGELADRYQRASFLGRLLLPAGLFILLIPSLTGWVIDRIVMRHPLDRPIPLVWQKLDPALGSALLFFLPCFVLATLTPYMIRLLARTVAHVGRTSGRVYAAGTAGGIAGVFITGYVLIDTLSLTRIFQATGALTLALGLWALMMDRWIRPEGTKAGEG